MNRKYTLGRIPGLVASIVWLSGSSFGAACPGDSDASTGEDPKPARPATLTPPDAGEDHTPVDAEAGRWHPEETIQQPGGLPALRADAGDDQVGLVGRRITLNGTQSEPRDRLVCRWIQMSGPRISTPSEEGAFYSFIPTAPGVYRFALVVAADVSISKPDEVVVIVGELPSNPRTAPARATREYDASALGQVVRNAGFLLDRGTLGQVADAFDAVAARISLYSTFADLTGEAMRRLDAIISRDPNQRQLWSHSIFNPLSQILAMEMLGTGLDLRLPQAHQQPLLPAQKDQLEKSFRSFAQAFRSKAAER